jgi:hypothetical protein
MNLSTSDLAVPAIEAKYKISAFNNYPVKIYTIDFDVMNLQTIALHDTIFLT